MGVCVASGFGWALFYPFLQCNEDSYIYRESTFTTKKTEVISIDSSNGPKAIIINDYLRNIFARPIAKILSLNLIEIEKHEGKFGTHLKLPASYFLTYHIKPQSSKAVTQKILRTTSPKIALNMFNRELLFRIPNASLIISQIKRHNESPELYSKFRSYGIVFPTNSIKTIRLHKKGWVQTVGSQEFLLSRTGNELNVYSNLSLNLLVSKTARNIISFKAKNKSDDSTWTLIHPAPGVTTKHNIKYLASLDLALNAIADDDTEKAIPWLKFALEKASSDIEKARCSLLLSKCSSSLYGGNIGSLLALDYLEQTHDNYLAYQRSTACPDKVLVSWIKKELSSDLIEISERYLDRTSKLSDRRKIKSHSYNSNFIHLDNFSEFEDFFNKPYASDDGPLQLAEKLKKPITKTLYKAFPNIEDFKRQSEADNPFYQILTQYQSTGALEKHQLSPKEECWIHLAALSNTINHKKFRINIFNKELLDESVITKNLKSTLLKCSKKNQKIFKKRLNFLQGSSDLTLNQMVEGIASSDDKRLKSLGLDESSDNESKEFYNHAIVETLNYYFGEEYSSGKGWHHNSQQRFLGKLVLEIFNKSEMTNAEKSLDSESREYLFNIPIFPSDSNYLPDDLNLDNPIYLTLKAMSLDRKTFQFDFLKDEIENKFGISYPQILFSNFAFGAFSLIDSTDENKPKEEHRIDHSTN